MQIKEYQEHFWVEFDNAVSVEIYTDDTNCGGIGRVKCGRTDIRCDELPVLPLVTTADGYQVRKLELEDYEEGEDGITVTFRPYISSCGHLEKCGPGGETRWNVSQWHREPERDRGGQLEMHLKEVNRTVGNIDLRGFSYSYKFRSRKYHPAHIIDRGSWELRGNATRNELIVPCQHREPRKGIENKKDAFSTEWEQEDQTLVQMRPFVTEMQGFTYQYDNHNILVTSFEDPDECVSVMQKDAGKNYLAQWHQMRGTHSPNGGSMETPAHIILCADLEQNEDHERLNQYDEIKRDMHERLREEWGVPEGRADIAGFLKPEIWHRPDEVQRGIAELGDAGCQEIVIPDLIYQSSAYDLGDEEVVPEQLVETVEDAIEAIHKRGMDATLRMHVTVLAAHEADSDEDTPQDVVEDWLDALTDQFDFDAVYLVSSVAESGVAPTHMHQIPDIPPLELEVAFHRAAASRGLRSAGSGFGPFKPTVRQVPFEAVCGNEFLYRDTIAEFPYVDVIEGKDKPKEAYFRGMANRLCYALAFGSQDGERPTIPDWFEHDFEAINTAFAAVREHMRIPKCLDEGRGILWASSEEDDAVRVLWSYEEVTLKADEDAQIYDVMKASPVEVEESGELTVEENSIYMIQGSAEV